MRPPENEKANGCLGFGHAEEMSGIGSLRSRGICDQTIRALSGHVGRQMLEHYSHIRSHAKQAATRRLEEQPSVQVLEEGRRTKLGTMTRTKRHPQLLSFWKRMVGLGRVELPTNGLGNRCSIHLSYRPTDVIWPSLHGFSRFTLEFPAGKSSTFRGQTR